MQVVESADATEGDGYEGEGVEVGLVGHARKNEEAIVNLSPQLPRV